MSAGKTTFINALLGKELLHAANEAATSCLTRLTHKPQAPRLHGALFSDDGRRLAEALPPSAQDLRAWSERAQADSIHLRGPLLRGVLADMANLVLIDTPGPNNSCDQAHGDVLRTAMETLPFQTICHILNVGHLGTTDERALLEEVRLLLMRRPGVRVLFMLNKADLLDAERGESLADLHAQATAYLTEAGFQNPLLLPISAQIGLIARKRLHGEPLTRKERAVLSMRLEEPPQSLSIPALEASGPSKLKIEAEFARYEAAVRRSLPPEITPSEGARLLRIVADSGVVTAEVALKQQVQGSV